MRRRDAMHLIKRPNRRLFFFSLFVFAAVLVLIRTYARREHGPTKTIDCLRGYVNYTPFTRLLKEFNKVSGEICGTGYSCQFRLNNLTSSLSSDLAVYFHGTITGAPSVIRRRSQLWAFMSGESPTMLPAVNLAAWDGLFNYSVTYLPSHEYAQMSNAYSSRYRKRDTPLKLNYTQLKLSTYPDHPKQANALWFVKNCMVEGEYVATSGRVEYAKALAQHISVDVHSQPTSDCHQVLRDLVKFGKEPQYSQFWFYLAFENSLCKDYITEKLWKILTDYHWTVPVVLGGLDMADYEKIAPPNSYIHVRNFTSPEHLARHLKYVAETPQAFNYYMQWRNDYQIIPDGGYFSGFPTMCYLCRLAHDRPRRVWTTFSRDFGSETCHTLSDQKERCLYYNLSSTCSARGSA